MRLLLTESLLLVDRRRRGRPRRRVVWTRRAPARSFPGSSRCSASRRASTCACSGGAWRSRSSAGCWSACCRRSRRRAPIRTSRSRPTREPADRAAGGAFVTCLVVAELALSVVLLLGAGLLMRSFLNIQRVDRGFDSQRRADHAADAAARALSRRRRRRVLRSAVGAPRGAARRARGVRRVAVPADPRPSARSSGSNGDSPDGQTLPTALITTATPSYFETLARAAARRPHPERRPIDSTRRPSR